MAKISFENEAEIEERDLELSLLEISLKHDIPHMQDTGKMCMHAVTAALQMEEALERVNCYLKQNFDEQVEIGQVVKTQLKGKSGDYLLYEALGLKNV